ncbi:hypothetical protein HDV57DRAFT_63991 [Trichoderma longibrachiatum]
MTDGSLYNYTSLPHTHLQRLVLFLLTLWPLLSSSFALVVWRDDAGNVLMHAAYVVLPTWVYLTGVFCIIDAQLILVVLENRYPYALACSQSAASRASAGKVKGLASTGTHNVFSEPISSSFDFRSPACHSVPGYIFHGVCNESECNATHTKGRTASTH